MDRIEVNVITGERQVISLTPEEIAEIQSRPQPEPPSPLALAEAHIASHFSTARLLQMKDWRDTFPEEDAPMLEAVYDWLNGITIQAAQGNANFTAPPHTFEELIAEAMFILGVDPHPTEPEPEPEPTPEPEPEPEP
jgi:hypothetical protein